MVPPIRQKNLHKDTSKYSIFKIEVLVLNFGGRHGLLWLLL